MAARGSKSMPRMKDNQKNDKRGKMTVTRCERKTKENAPSPDRPKWRRAGTRACQ